MFYSPKSSQRVYLAILNIALVSIVVSSYVPNYVLSFTTTRRTNNIRSNVHHSTNTKRFPSPKYAIKNIPLPLSMSASSAAMPDGPSDWDNERRSQKQQQQQQQSQEEDDGKARNILPTQSNPPSPERLLRMEEEAKAKSKFLHGDELIELRKYINNLELDLNMAKEKQDGCRIKDLSQALHDSRNLDAEFVYVNSLEMAEASDTEKEAKEWKKLANEARNCLPQFNLQGLWVGKYGDHGYEMVNVTYIGDTLVATKVTGDKNVPKGEITFTANLHPNAKGRTNLEPIELSDVASKQWGHKHLPRFPGQGQVASEGFINNQWMDGQLILVGEYFSFAWIPLGHQIFFGRPSAELTLKMLKQSKMADFGAVDKGSPNQFAEMRAHAEKCFDETEILLDSVDGELCFMMDDDNYFCQEGVFE